MNLKNISKFKKYCDLRYSILCLENRELNNYIIIPMAI